MLIACLEQFVKGPPTPVPLAQVPNGNTWQKKKASKGHRRRTNSENRHPSGPARGAVTSDLDLGPLGPIKSYETGRATTMRLRLYPPRSARKLPAQVISTSRGGPPMSKISLSSTRSVRGTWRSVVILYACRR